MFLPRGNRLMPEGLKMQCPDLQRALDNLRSEQASAYLRWDMPGGRSAFAFVASGQLLRTFELDSSGQATAYPLNRLLQRTGGSKVSAWSYLLPVRHTMLFAQSLAMQSLHEDRMMGKKEIKSVIDEMEQMKYSGFIRVETPASTGALVFDQGEMMLEIFVTHYGEILCGRDRISEFLDCVHAEGGKLTARGGLKPEMDSKVARIEQELGRLVQVTTKSISGFFASKDTMKIDAEIAKSWGVSGTFHVQLEDDDRRVIGSCKAVAAASKGDVIDIPLKVMQSWNVSEGQKVWMLPGGGL